MKEKKVANKSWQPINKSAKIKESLEAKILKILTNKKFTRKKPDLETLDFLLKKIKGATDNSEPLTLLICFGYCKNPNATSNFLPDLAEELSFQQFHKLAKKIGEIYQPGMKVTIVTTGRLAERVNGILPRQTLLYHQALLKLIRKKGWDKTIELIPISDLYQERQEDLKKTLTEVEKEVQKEWNDPTKQEFWIKQIEHARRNIAQKQIAENEIIEKARKAAFDYIVYKRAQKKIGLFEQRFPEAIQASYNTGHKNTLILWTLGKGNITQPWQGEAREIEGKVIVMTQARLKKYETKSC